MPHIKKLVKRLRQAAGDPNHLFYHRTHPPPNKLAEDTRDKVVALKRENRGRSNPLIGDLLCDETGIRVCGQCPLLMFALCVGRRFAGVPERARLKD